MDLQFRPLIDRDQLPAMGGPGAAMILCFALTGALAGCTVKPERTLIIGHGGMGDDHDLPMNSSASVMEALALGADGVELDVQLTADGVLVAFHDEALHEATGCSGLVHGSTWEQLRQCALIARPGTTHRIERLDSILLQAVRTYPAREFALDCKLFTKGDWWSYLGAFADALVQLNRIPGLHGNLLVECQVDDLLLLVQRRNPFLPLYRYGSDADAIIQRAAASHFTGIVVDHDRIDADQVRWAQELDLEVTVFGTAGRFGHWRALRLGPDRLQTDAPGLLVPRTSGHLRSIPSP